MSNIDKQTLREAAERSQASRDRLAPLDSEDIFDENGEIRDSVQKDMAIMIAFNDQTNPATVLTLLDELEAKDKRIAELEAREVTLPRPVCTYADHSYPAYSELQVVALLESLGIRINGEGE